MSDVRFTEGNLIVLYAIHYNRNNTDNLPDFIKARIEVCIKNYRIIKASKPDNNKTSIIIVCNKEDFDMIQNQLTEEGIDPSILSFDSKSKNLNSCFENILNIIRDQINPPSIYFVGSVWLKDLFDSITISKMKGYKVHFEGALDHRSVDEVEKDKRHDSPKKGIEYVKKKTKDKAIDIFLNYIFSKEKDKK